MSSSIRLRARLFSLVPLFAVMAPFAATADEAHSWCIPGDPKDPNGSSVPQVNTIVGYVCNLGTFNYCCDRNPQHQGKWDVACIQMGSNYAFNTLKQDVCGRYAWTQGPVTGTQQYYPRDFNLVAVGGPVSGLSDVEGPVASKGLATAANFRLNSAQSEAIALAAQGGVSLTNGTVAGNVMYAGTYSANNSVTYVNGYPPSAPSSTSPFPLDFSSANTKLKDMSLALNKYPTTPGSSASKTNANTLKFKSTDQVLNVFSISANLLANTYSYVFDVPPQSSVIVNVNATTPGIASAGFTDANGHGLGPRNMLWNFPGATSLTIQSVAFPGSILAPYAVADLNWGDFNGTAVVWSANVTQQLHFHRFHFPGCTGCLCLDQSWSCSNDTTLDDTGTPPELLPEAGFLFINGGQYTAESTTRHAPDHRIWYSFRPSGQMPKTKPLAVFFNGGLGAATSAMLFSFDTGPVKQIDPTGNATSLTLVSNYNSWTDFANLLYIDAPATGFSYPLPHLPHDDGDNNDVGTDIDEDAGIFLRILVQFLHRHPALVRNRVILVGESYGGTRASLMLQYLYNYSSLASGAYRDDRLRTDLLRYFSEAYSTQAPSAPQIKTTFGHLALIDPVVAGELQTMNSGKYIPPTQICLPSANIPDSRRPAECWIGWTTTGGVDEDPTCDPYNCNKPVVNGIDWGWQLSDLAGQNLTNVPTLNQMVGVNATTIEWMKASARTQAFGRDQAYVETPIQSPTLEWLNTFGRLSSATDNYYIVENDRVRDSYGCLKDFGGTNLCTGTPARSWDTSGVDVGGAFVLDAYRLWGTLITVTKYDVYVPSQAIADALNTGLVPYVLPCPQPSGINCGAWYNPTYLTGCSLPGVMGIAYQPIDGHTGIVVNVRMPTAYNAGHSVTMQDGDRFKADVQEWFHETAF